jgi:hypothetical protein
MYDWVELVAGVPRDSWRGPYYIKNWNVIDKIREAKKAGVFHTILIEDRQPHPVTRRF